ncbi:MAG: D-alanyl-D-alanine carboxypeptidase [Thermomicrobiales bacterium]|nr:D-alanyl-D-alanine carboxypeptidase [Thermomicrobiales bacterium]
MGGFICFSPYRDIGIERTLQTDIDILLYHLGGLADRFARITHMLTRRQLMATGVGVLLGSTIESGAAQEAEELQINSTRYIATNAETGAIFAQRDANEQVAIASLTKIFTAMEAVNLAPLDTIIVTTEDDMVSSEATVMGFGPGESFTLEELIFGMLLPSGNDAAQAIARALGAEEGDDADTAVQRFMDLVNQRVQDMGLQNTHLLNPDGWGVDGHYSSAADVAAFMAYASHNDFVLQVMGTKSFTTSNGYTVTNTNKVLTSAPSVIGGKTGYDDDAGYCLVQIAQREDTRIIAVTLDGIAPDDWYNDNLVLLDYGFEQQDALGTKAFTGEFVTWTNPDTAVFLQAGTGSASIIGNATSGESVVQEVDKPLTVPERVTTENATTTATDSVSFSGRKSSALLTGIGGAVMVGTMAASRWRDLGGDASMESLGAGFSAAGHSLKNAVLPGKAPSRSKEAGSDLMVGADVPLDDLPNPDEQSDTHNQA